MFNKVSEKEFFKVIIENIEKKEKEMDEYDKEFLNIEINAIIKEMSRGTYEKITKTKGFAFYFYEKIIDLYVNDKEEIETLENELKEIVKESTIKLYIDKYSEKQGEDLKGENSEQIIKKIIEIIKSKEFKEKKSKIRIKKK